ncbi:MAG: vWA domain-containing protein [Longimicrobiales bacterium]
MSFARPDLLWLALAAPILIALALWLHVGRRRHAIDALGGESMARRLGGQTLVHFAPMRGGLLLAAAALLGLAAAGPQWGVRPTTGATRSLDIVLALDASKSMLAEDVPPSRLEREKLFASRLLRELGGDRIGLVAFAGRGYVLAPLTVDHSALQLYLDALDPGIISAGGTAISSGLRQATDLARGSLSAGDRAVVLITDGEALEDRGAVLEAAERAAAAGVIVHTVGVGTPEGARVPAVDASGRVTGFIRDVDGSIVVSRLDEGLLGRIAELTGGVYVRLGAAGATETLLAALAGLERGVSASAGARSEPISRAAWVAAAALLLLALEAALAARERSGFGARRRIRLTEEGA